MARTMPKQRVTRADTMPAAPQAEAPPDPAAERFHCPFEGCTRSFMELWRLKVHYRAAPDVRGSGRERGHGMELEACPKCCQVLKPGKHHVGCFGVGALSQPEKPANKRHRSAAGFAETTSFLPGEKASPLKESASNTSSQQKASSLQKAGLRTGSKAKATASPAEQTDASSRKQRMGRSRSVEVPLLTLPPTKLQKSLPASPQEETDKVPAARSFSLPAHLVGRSALLKRAAQQQQPQQPKNRAQASAGRHGSSGRHKTLPGGRRVSAPAELPDLGFTASDVGSEPQGSSSRSQGGYVPIPRSPLMEYDAYGSEQSHLPEYRPALASGSILSGLRLSDAATAQRRSDDLHIQSLVDGLLPSNARRAAHQNPWSQVVALQQQLMQRPLAAVEPLDTFSLDSLSDAAANAPVIELPDPFAQPSVFGQQAAQQQDMGRAQSMPYPTMQQDRHAPNTQHLTSFSVRGNLESLLAARSSSDACQLASEAAPAPVSRDDVVRDVYLPASYGLHNADPASQLRMPSEASIRTGQPMQSAFALSSQDPFPPSPRLRPGSQQPSFDELMAMMAASNAAQGVRQTGRQSLLDAGRAALRCQETGASWNGNSFKVASALADVGSAGTAAAQGLPDSLAAMQPKHEAPVSQHPGFCSAQSAPLTGPSQDSSSLQLGFLSPSFSDLGPEHTLAAACSQPEAEQLLQQQLDRFERQRSRRSMQVQESMGMIPNPLQQPWQAAERVLQQQLDSFTRQQSMRSSMELQAGMHGSMAAMPGRQASDVQQSFMEEFDQPEQQRSMHGIHILHSTESLQHLQGFQQQQQQLMDDFARQHFQATHMQQAPQQPQPFSSFEVSMPDDLLQDVGMPNSSPASSFGMGLGASSMGLPMLHHGSAAASGAPGDARAWSLESDQTAAGDG